MKNHLKQWLHVKELYKHSLINQMEISFVIKGLIHGILRYINVCCSIPPIMTFLFCTSIVKLSDGKMVAKYQTWSYQRISSTDRCYYVGMKVKNMAAPTLARYSTCFWWTNASFLY